METLHHLWGQAWAWAFGHHISWGSRAAFVAAVTTAGATEINMDNMPKGWLIAAVLGMFGWISFFVKRDYTRITTHQDKTDATLARIEAKISTTVTHESLGQSLGRIHEKINVQNQQAIERIVALEAHLGLYRPTPADNDKKAG